MTDGKVKVNLGDDPDRTGEYTFDFTINNLSEKALAYVLHAGINTMAVEEIEGENYMSDTARVLSPKVTFDVEGGTSYLYDLNGDGAPSTRTMRSCSCRSQTARMTLCS